MRYLWKGANPSLGGTTKNHPKEWSRNQKQPNHFPRPLILNLFTTINIFYSMFINCMHKYMALKFILKLKNWKIVKILYSNKNGPFRN